MNIMNYFDNREDCTKVVHCRFESVKDGLVKESFPFFGAAKLMIENKEGILERRFQPAQEGKSVRRYVRKAIK